LLFPPWWLLPLLLQLFPVILTASKNIMQPAPAPGIVMPVKTVSIAAIAPKTVVPVAFANNNF